MNKPIIPGIHVIPYTGNELPGPPVASRPMFELLECAPDRYRYLAYKQWIQDARLARITSKIRRPRVAVCQLTSHAP